MCSPLISSTCASSSPVLVRALPRCSATPVSVPGIWPATFCRPGQRPSRPAAPQSPSPYATRIPRLRERAAHSPAARCFFIRARCAVDYVDRARRARTIVPGRDSHPMWQADYRLTSPSMGGAACSLRDSGGSELFRGSAVVNSDADQRDRESRRWQGKSVGRSRSRRRDEDPSRARDAAARVDHRRRSQHHSMPRGRPQFQRRICERLPPFNSIDARSCRACFPGAENDAS